MRTDTRGLARELFTALLHVENMAWLPWAVRHDVSVGARHRILIDGEPTAAECRRARDGDITKRTHEERLDHFHYRRDFTGRRLIVWFGLVHGLSALSAVIDSGDATQPPRSARAAEGPRRGSFGWAHRPPSAQLREAKRHLTTARNALHEYRRAREAGEFNWPVPS